MLTSVNNCISIHLQLSLSVNVKKKFSGQRLPGWHANLSRLPTYTQYRDLQHVKQLKQLNLPNF